MRDVGADWDFADVRDHYLGLLHGVGRGHDDYWERARIVTGEVMAEVFGEWRRARSRCGGGIVLWSRDLADGAGWGLLDHRGDPKVVWHFLRRALAPVAVWTTDEGLNGIAVHLANDGADPWASGFASRSTGTRRRASGKRREDLELGARTALERSVEGLLGRFVDVSSAYRFGAATAGPRRHEPRGPGRHAGDGLSLSRGPAARPTRPLGTRSRGCRRRPRPTARCASRSAACASSTAHGSRRRGTCPPTTPSASSRGAT